MVWGVSDIGLLSVEDIADGGRELGWKQDRPDGLCDLSCTNSLQPMEAGWLTGKDTSTSTVSNEFVEHALQEDIFCQFCVNLC